MRSSGAESLSDKPGLLDFTSSYLLDFFTIGGRSVLVRGDPGTGKTSLALQLLDFHSKNGFKSIYVSTRLSAKTLKSHQPWVEVVQGKYGTMPRLEEDQIGFQDSRRMDGVRAISGLRQYLGQVSNPFVVLDSWEGLFFESHAMGVEEVSKLVEDYETRFVVVTERREQTDLDYLLDGVVVLRRKFHEGRILREIELKKLRGVNIRQSRFLFTLDSGKFRYLSPFSVVDSSNEGRDVGEPIESRRKVHLSTGAETLDSVIGGGFKRGSFNLLELGNSVPKEVTHLLLRTVFSNFVNSGHCVVYVPFVATATGEIEEILTNLSTQTIERSIAVFGYGGEKERNTGIKGEFAADFSQINSKVESLQASSGKAVLVVLMQDALEGFYGTDSISVGLARSIARAKGGDNIWVQISSPQASLLSELKAISDTSIKVDMIHGTPILYADKPTSGLNGLTPDPASSGKLKLVPIV